VSERIAPGAPVVVSVRPEPEPPVLAAIIVAVEQSWPRPPAGDDDVQTRHPAWRFSGRWWNQPVAMSRRRPVVGH
jgi:hypothetical protein